MKIVAFVPIKLNSERVKGKNIKEFDNGRPLCSYIFNTLSKVKGLDGVYVYCSDERIKDYIPEGIKFLKRDARLDGSDVKINEVLTSFAKDVDADAYLLTHATAPFITVESIEKGIDVMRAGEYDSVLAVSKIQEFLWMNNKPFNYSLDAIPRTQDLEPIYSETCGLYIYRRELILDENRRIGHNPFLLEVSKIEALDVDTVEDFMICNAVSNIIKESE